MYVNYLMFFSIELHLSFVILCCVYLYTPYKRIVATLKIMSFEEIFACDFFSRKFLYLHKLENLAFFWCVDFSRNLTKYNSLGAIKAANIHTYYICKQCKALKWWCKALPGNVMWHELPKIRKMKSLLSKHFPKNIFFPMSECVISKTFSCGYTKKNSCGSNCEILILIIKFVL